MAKDSVEVEIKIPVSKAKFEKVKRLLSKKAKLLGISNQIDKYYDPPHRSFISDGYPQEFLRLRKFGRKSFFTYKRGYWNRKGEHTHSDEYETIVDKAQQLEKVLLTLNFENFLTINKTRETYLVSKDFEVVLDKVKKLGYFIEVECLKTFGSREKAMDKLYQYARDLKLDPEKRDSKGYVALLMEKKGLLK
jgi:predicted adenylyl cyclase CyaB